MQKVAILFLVLWFPFLLKGQDCPKYYQAMEKGYELLTNPDSIARAILEFQAAQLAARECGLDAKRFRPAQGLNKAYDLLKGQRDEALAAKARAEEAERIARAAQLRAENANRAAIAARVSADSSAAVARREEAKAITERKKAEKLLQEIEQALKDLEKAQAKNQKIIDAFYFYKNRFALAYKNGMYGFINPDGDPEIPYQYDFAMPFDEKTGLALVMKEGREFLIDTSGTEYQIARSLEEINENTQALYLDHRDLDAIPAGILGNTKMKVLVLSGNNLQDVNGLETVENLEHLDLSNNQIAQLPVGFEKLKKLKSLNLSQNRLTGFPEELKALSELEILLAADNRLSEFPSFIVQNKKLRLLDLSGNQISSFPADLASLQLLSKINVSNNLLRSIPPEIGRLSELEEFKLNLNLIQSLPEEMGGMRKLRLLDIGFNQVGKVPDAILRLPNLQTLIICGNRLRAPIANPGQLSVNEQGNLFPEQKD